MTVYKTSDNPVVPRIPEKPEDWNKFAGELQKYLEDLEYSVRKDLESTESSKYEVGDFKIYADMTGTPALDSTFKLCDGSLISDSDSVYNGKRIYNMVGADVVITVTWTADAGGAYATFDADDLWAVDLADEVSGTGIAADTKITDISGTTVTISDTAATGEIETTFTNDGLAIYGGSGGSQGDQMQLLEGAASAAGEFGIGLLRRVTDAGYVEGVFSVGDNCTYSPGGEASRSGSQLGFNSSGSPNARTSATTAGRTTAHARKLPIAMKIKE